MVTALQAQLAKAASANATLLADRDKRGKHRVQSYLFTARDADHQDLAVVHALGLNGFARLVILNNDLRQYEDALFSPAARDTDRTLLDQDTVKELDAALDGFLLALSPYLLDAAAGKALEWLVRRFRIHEFNVDAVLRLFLPYHESPHFAKMLNILHIESSPTWTFLAPFKNAAKPLPRAALVTEMRKTTAVSRFVASIHPGTVTANCSSDTVVSFNASVLLDFFAGADAHVLNEETLAFLLPALVLPLMQDKSSQSCLMGSLLLLAALSQKCRLTADALRTILKSVVKAKRVVAPSQLQATLVAICGPQEQLQELPRSVVDVLAANADAFAESLQLEGAETLFIPLCRELVPTDTHTEVVSVIIQAATTPEVVLKMICGLVIAAAAKESSSAMHTLLATLKQRRPEIFTVCADESRALLGDAVVDEIVVSASMPGIKGHGRMYVAANDADAGVRAAGVRELLQSVANSTVEDEESVRGTLLERIADPAAEVVAALYAESSTLQRLISHADLVAAIASALRTGQELARPVLRSHLEYLAENGTEDEVARVFWPWLLISGPRKKRATIAWEVLSAASAKNIGLFQGCAALATAEASEDEYTKNGTVAKRIAENILTAPALEPQVNFVLELAAVEESHSSLLALLVLRALLAQLRGEHLAAIAPRVLDALRSRMYAHDWPKAAAEFTAFVAEAALLRAVANKPNKPNTLQRALAAVAILLAATPVASHTDWFGASLPARGVYAVASPAVRSEVLRARGPDALLFLVGVVLNETDVGVRVAALRHAGAFVKAATQGEDLQWDVQAVLPALVIALGDQEQSVRRAAAEALPPTGGRDPKLVYGYDVVYGARTELVQYLDWPDVVKFVRALAEQKEQLVQDPAYLSIFMQRLLSRGPRDAQRESQFKQRVLCYLCSHVVASAGGLTSTALLRALEHVASPDKAVVLYPLLVELGTASSTVGPVVAQLVAAAYDATTGARLVEDDPFWTDYVAALERCAGDDIPTFAVFVKHIQSGLFAALGADRQLELANALLKIGVTSSSSDVYNTVKAAITQVVTNVELVIPLLRQLRQTAPATVDERASKRVKTTDAAPETSLQSLVLLAEALVPQKLPGGTELIVCLLEVLASVAKVDGTDYARQVIMKVLDVCADARAAQATPNSTVRLDVLVEVIRSKPSPQTLHQALLLFAKMAKLAPESMIYNIMPIFTFMGSDVVNRDDAYSFRVVQQTLDMIIPLVVSSLRSSNGTGSELQIAAKTLVKTLTDASNHIPRHRRTMFFTHLAQTLGPDEFLAPVCLLLVDTHSKKVLRQTGEDLRNTLSLPLAVMGHFQTGMKLKALADALRECQQLLAVATGNLGATSFLWQAPQHDGSAIPESTAVKQLHAVLVFLRECLLTFPPMADVANGLASTGLKDSIAILMALNTTLPATGENGEINAVASGALFDLLRVSPVKTFVATVMDIVRGNVSPSSPLLHRALDVLRDRLPAVSLAARGEISPSTKELVDRLRDVLQTPDTSDDTMGHVLALKTLQAVATSSLQSESGVLAGVVPVALQVGNSATLTAEVLTLIGLLIPKVGPRMVAHFHAVVNFCVSTASGDIDEERSEAVQHVLTGLLSALPVFWGSSELQAVLALSLQEPVSLYHALRRQLAKKVPATALLPAFSEGWTKLFNEGESRQPSSATIAFFDIVKRAVQNASRSDVQAHLKALSKLFLGAFDLRNTEAQVPLAEFSEEAEDMVIQAFLQLVIKLNEIAFTPVFRQFYDWAYSEDTASTRFRKVTFARTVSSLLDTFKGLMDPYVVLIMDGVVDVLQIFTRDDDSADAELWLSTVTLVQKSLAAEDSAYWRDDRIRKIMPVLVDQIAALPSGAAHQKALVDTLVALAHAAGDSAVLKAINLAVLMHTRSDEAHVRLLALVVADAIWREDGGAVQEFATETETFVLECAEDDNDDVCKAARKLQKAIDAASGN
ncbi:hypothetical protein AURDEDRAFT_185221 [Auricularia subglabra TFB-10046 SS5]|nr:hypothetical protein AURDEDRAFT_185221 [Auricularia subglabra TFB-10046 SS5]